MSKVYWMKSLKYNDEKKVKEFCQKENLSYEWALGKGHWLIIDHRDHDDLTEKLSELTEEKIKTSKRGNHTQAREALRKAVYRAVNHSKEEVTALTPEYFKETILKIENTYLVSMDEDETKEIITKTIDDLTGYFLVL